MVNIIILSTDSFSADKNNYLMQLLFDKFKLQFLTDGKNQLHLYDPFQIIYFLHLVPPWMQEPMNSRAMLKQPLRFIAKGTILFLPAI